MIQRYTKGEQLVSVILNEAKKQFYENGYKKTKLKNIAAESGIQLGNLTYYFPTKSALLTELYGQFTNKIIILSDFKLTNKDTALITMARSGMLYYLSLFGDPVTAKFHYDMLSEGSLEDIISSYQNGSYSLYSLKNCDNQTKKTIITADIGARRELILDFLSTTNFLPQKNQTIKFGEDIFRVTCRLFSIEDARIDNTISMAKKDLDYFDYRTINLLQ